MASEITPRTEIRLPLWQLIGGLVIILGVFFGFNQYFFGGLKDDVRQLNGLIHNAEAENRIVERLLHGTERELANKITDTNDRTIKIEARLDAMAGDLNQVKTDLHEIRNWTLKHEPQ